MRLLYAKTKACQSFWSWLYWTWTYPNPHRSFPAKFYCWRFCGLTWDIEFKDIGRKYWNLIREDKLPGVYKLLKGKFDND